MNFEMAQKLCKNAGNPINEIWRFNVKTFLNYQINNPLDNVLLIARKIKKADLDFDIKTPVSIPIEKKLKLIRIE